MPLCPEFTLDVSSLDFEFTLGVCLLAFLPGVGGGVKIGKISAIFQSKTLVPQSKNQIFQKFLSSFTKTSYERRATRNGYIFVSKVQIALIIEALLFSPPAKSSQISKSQQSVDPPSFGGLKL